MNPDRDFGLWLRQLRSERDLTQEMLAEAVGCANQTVRSFESGRRRPSREMAARFADILSVPDDERAAFVQAARRLLPAGARQTGRVDVATPVGAAPVRPSSLPTPRIEGLIGRHREEEQLRRALVDEQRRLLTILGPGGVGKTSLALQTVATLSAQGVSTASVALASVGDVAGMIAACANAVGCSLSGVSDPQAALVSFLAERPLLLLLDNLEHLLSSEHVDNLADLLLTILDTAPHIALLATSRERLRLRAESVIEIGGLSLPQDDQPTTIAHSDAVLLFVERARRVASNFALGPQNQAAVAQICRRLDGLPLALELAAAQVSFLPPEALLARLDRALPLLEGGARDLPARQRTMRATIRWSYDLLRADERAVFERLGVFVGSWSLQAAEAVCAGGTIRSTHVLPLLRQLTDRSLVVHDMAASDEARYRLLEPVRQFALEQLEHQPTEIAQVRERHAAFFHALAQSSFLALRGPQQARWVLMLEQAWPNLHAAMDWLLAQGDVEAAADFGYALWSFLWVRGHFRAGQQWMKHILRLAPEPTLARAHALLVASILAYGQAEYERAAPLADEALAAYHAIDYPDGFGYSTAMRGLIAAGLGQNARAVTFMADAVACLLQAGTVSHIWSAALTLTYWAPIPLKQGDYAEAARLSEQALALARSIGDRIGAYSALSTLALVGQAENKPALAKRHFREALNLALEIGDVGNVIVCLSGLGSVAAEQGDWQRAVRMWAVAETALAHGEVARYTYTIDRDRIAVAVEAFREQIDTTTFAAMWSEGSAMTITDAVRYALESHE